MQMVISARAVMAMSITRERRPASGNRPNTPQGAPAKESSPVQGFAGAARLIAILAFWFAASSFFNDATPRLMRTLQGSGGTNVEIAVHLTSGVGVRGSEVSQTLDGPFSAAWKPIFARNLDINFPAFFDIYKI